MSSAPRPAPRISTDQERAQWAWKAVQRQLPKGYVELVKSVPTMVMGSGLIQTIAFLAEKGKDHHKLLLDQLCDRKQPTQWISELVEMKPQEYRAATEEALARLRWLRHFAAVVNR